MPKAVPNIVAPDPISHVASWLTPASADVTDKPTTTPLEDPVIALVADARRLEELWGAAYEKKHDREANAIDKQMGAILNQLRNRNIKPVTIAGAIAMLELGLRCFPDISFRFAETDEPLVDAAIAGLRDMQPEASRISPANPENVWTAPRIGRRLNSRLRMIREFGSSLMARPGRRNRITLA
jgi:hypothetical protein